MTTVIPQDDDFANDAVTIPVDEYLKLCEEVKFLRQLERHGVEMWEGYGLAFEAWRTE